MKTAVFITHRFFHLYDFHALQIISDLRLVAIISEQSLSEIDETVKRFLQAVYISPKPSSKQFTSPINLDFAQSVIQAEIELYPEHEIHIICNDDVSMLLTAYLREQYNLKGMTSQEILPFCDKLVSKSILLEQGIRVPKFEPLNVPYLLTQTEQYFANLVLKVGLPFIVKPKNAASSSGVKKINCLKQLVRFKNESTIEFNDYEVEEYIQGNMYHCDSVIKDQEIIFSECSKYNYPMGEFLEGRNIASIPLTNDNPLRKVILNFTTSVLKALNYPQGTTHLELFVSDKKELVFLEIAARCPGGLAVNVYKETYNIDILECDLRIKLGLPLDMKLKMSRYSFWALMPLRNGIAISLNPAPIKSQHHIIWKIKESQICQESKSLAEVSAALFAWSDDYKVLEEDYKNLTDYQAVTYSTTN
jgi:biotin carboxylase